MTDTKLSLSIIVPAYTPERLKDIRELLDSLQNQTYNNIREIVFVIEQSTELYDGLNEYVKNKSLSNAKIVFNPDKLGICAARNLGVRQAQGDIIAFTDDDAIPLSDWAEQMVRTYEDSSIIGVTGPAIPLWEDESMAWFPEEFYWIIGCTAWYTDSKVNGVTSVRNAWGMNMSFRREAFNFCQFAENLGISGGAHKLGKVGLVGDDTEFSMNLSRMTKRPIAYNPEVKVWHKVYRYRLTPQFIRRQAYWQGYTKAVFKKLYGNGDMTENVLATEYRLLRRILLKLPSSIFVGFFSHPVIAWKRLRLTIAVLFNLSLGYFSAILPILGKATRKAYGSDR